MKTRLRKALEYIAGYCEKHTRCSDCPLSGYEGVNECLLVVCPTEWDVEAMKAKREADNAGA